MHQQRPQGPADEAAGAARPAAPATTPPPGRSPDAGPKQTVPPAARLPHAGTARPAGGTADTPARAGTSAPGGEALSGGLKQRHLTMLGLGGAIGAGLFVGSGAGIAVAGPGIVVSYLIAGALATCVMRMLGEMSAALPASGSFSVHAERALGRWAGFTVGWLYWFMVVVVLAVEATGAAQIAHGWLPGVPQWAWVLVFMLFFTVSNLAAVRNFGEFEFWFAALKVTAIVLFLVLGVLAILGLLPDTHAVGLTNLTGARGGFLPGGWDGVLSGVLAVVFAFGGLEVVTIAAAESDDPARSVARAVRSALYRIVFFYVGSMLVIVTVLPWTAQKAGLSPYVTVLGSLGVPSAATLMNIVVFVALLSALNANLYGSSRMLFSLSERGEAPKALLKVAQGFPLPGRGRAATAGATADRAADAGAPARGAAAEGFGAGVPQRAVLASVVFGFLSVLLNLKWPDTVFLYLLNAAGAVLLYVWVLIAVSQLRLRRRLEREAPERLLLRMWAYPWLTWAALAVMASVLGLMAHDAATRPQVLWSTGAVVVLLVAAGARELRARRAASVSGNAGSAEGAGDSRDSGDSGDSKVSVDGT